KLSSGAQRPAKRPSQIDSRAAPDRLPAAAVTALEPLGDSPRQPGDFLKLISPEQTEVFFRGGFDIARGGEIDLLCAPPLARAPGLEKENQPPPFAPPRSEPGLPGVCRMVFTLDDLPRLIILAERAPETFEELLENREVLYARGENASQTQKGLLPVVEPDQTECRDGVNRLGRRHQETTFSERPAEQNCVIEEVITVQLISHDSWLGQ